MKFLGIDFGEKRIGLATAEGGFGNAHAAATVASLDEVVAFIKTHGPFEHVVMGLPRNMDGEETSQTAQVREAAADLSDRLGIQVDFVDEFDTSNIAKARLLDSGRAFKQEEIDSEAAAIILDDFLVELE